MAFSSHRVAVLLLLLSTALVTTLVYGCTSGQPQAASAPVDDETSAAADYIPYEDVDRRDFVDAGVRVRTDQGNRVSVEVAEKDTLVWFEREQTGRFERAFLRRGNTVYVLLHDSDYVRSSPSESVAYRLFMQAWHQADATGESVTSPSYADE